MRKYLIGVLILVTSISLVLAIGERDRRIRLEAVASERIEKDSIKIAAYTDSLNTAREALQKSVRDVGASFARYDSLRSKIKPRYVTVIDTIYSDTGSVRIDTLRLAAVDDDFVASADSLKRSCSALLQDCTTFRIVADSLLRYQRNQTQNYKTLYENSNKSCYKEGGVAAAIGFIGGLLAK